MGLGWMGIGTWEPNEQDGNGFGGTVRAFSDRKIS